MELRPCPFCGGEAFIRRLYSNYMVDAKHDWNCPMSNMPVPYDTHWVTQLAAEVAWNRRADEGCPQVVDAITVEWLKQQFYDSPNSQWAEKCRDVFTGWQRWQRLQKEQEGANGQISGSNATVE